MGESLERVQNKFACIIGELCNEPVVLSKFAIWLDLRLAEYKAKGAISLDCSGESPDPKWLKGHEKPEPVVYKTDNHSYRLGNVGTHDIFNYGSNTSQPQGPPETKFGLNSNIIEDINERLSPEIVVVKEEVPDMPNSENIYPVGLHVHDQKTRKRPSTDIFPTSSPKSQRHMEDSSSISAQTGTQSLMSIIGENTDDIKDEHLSQSRGDNPMTFMPHTSIADQSYPQATISSPDESSSSQNYSSFHPQIDQTYSPNQSRQNAGLPGGPPTCEVCFKVYSCMSSLRRHRSVHKPGSKRHQCAHCPAKFHRREHLKKHQRRVHTNDPELAGDAAEVLEVWDMSP